MKIAIYGAGALGTVLGAYLSKAGTAALLVNRNREHVTALLETGATVTGTVSMTAKVEAATPECMGDGFDVIFLMTKQQHNAETAEFLAPKLLPDGVLCTLQNGLPEPLLEQKFGPGRVIGCTVIWGATMESPGRVRLTSNPDSMSFQIGCIGQSGPNLERVGKILQQMCPVVLEKNFIGARWGKLLINAAFSGLSAATGLLFGEVANRRDTRRVAQRVIKECIDVAKAAGITIEPVQGKDVVKLMDYSGLPKRFFSYMLIPIAMRNHKLIRSGMLGDIERGQKTEVDAINGVVCGFGRKYGQPTPFNDRIVDIIHSIEEGALSPAVSNMRVFDDLL